MSTIKFLSKNIKFREDYIFAVFQSANYKSSIEIKKFINNLPLYVYEYSLYVQTLDGFWREYDLNIIDGEPWGLVCHVKADNPLGILLSPALYKRNSDDFFAVAKLSFAEVI